MNRIIVCDDEPDIVSALKIYLASEENEVIGVGSGDECLRKIEELGGDISLLLLDIMMPGTDGIVTLGKIRQQYNFPVIMLSAKSEDSDKILGLDLGADDYITKPFNPAELRARVRSQLRRYKSLGVAAVKDDGIRTVIKGLELDERSKKVTVDGEEVNLTKTEYEILRLLVKEPGKVFSTAEIYTGIWNEDPMGAENTVAVHIRHIREKIEIDPACPRYIKVVWGHGYMVEEDN